MDEVPVTVTCRVLKLARQPYYRWLDLPVTDAEFGALRHGRDQLGHRTHSSSWRMVSLNANMTLSDCAGERAAKR
ncbi:hypothetical protein [Streptomyces sp. NPDC051576]|uniref:hypothetical protein n=1 Tax=Streptomyces sp. NPDC051576 TaxID=3155803 RepID=UPI00341EC21D